MKNNTMTNETIRAAAAEALSAVLEAQRMPSRKNLIDQHEAEHEYILVLEQALDVDPWTEEEEEVITISRAEYDELVATKTKFELAKAHAAESGYRDAVDRMLFDLAESPDQDCKSCDGTCNCGKTLCPKL